MVLTVIFVAALTLAHSRTPPQQPVVPDIDQFIQRLASEAVKDAEARYQVHLDYSIESIRTVDTILGRLHYALTKRSASVNFKTLGSVYGAYVGEVIRRNNAGAKWQRDDQIRGNESYPLIWSRLPTGSPLHVYTFAWCERRILKGSKAPSVWTAYSEAKQLASQGII